MANLNRGEGSSLEGARRAGESEDQGDGVLGLDEEHSMQGGGSIEASGSVTEGSRAASSTESGSHGTHGALAISIGGLLAWIKLWVRVWARLWARMRRTFGSWGPTRIK